LSQPLWDEINHQLLSLEEGSLHSVVVLSPTALPSKSPLTITKLLPAFFAALEDEGGFAMNLQQ